MQKGAEAYTTENMEDYHAFLIAAGADAETEAVEETTEEEAVEEEAVDAETEMTDEMPDVEMIETPE
jgi:hypothetical protein